jgi:hypothetical protein
MRFLRAGIFGACAFGNLPPALERRRIAAPSLRTRHLIYISTSETFGMGKHAGESGPDSANMALQRPAKRALPTTCRAVTVFERFLLLRLVFSFLFLAPLLSLAPHKFLPTDLWAQAST